MHINRRWVDTSPVSEVNYTFIRVDSLIMAPLIAPFVQRHALKSIGRIVWS